MTATTADALRIEHLSKSYGALVVTDDVCLSVAPNSIHALIGPNGAGKSTLIGQLAGELQPDAGRILLFGEDITSTLPEDRARRGLSRSYQISAVLPEFTLLQNVLLAHRARRAHLTDMRPGLLRDPQTVAHCRDALNEVGLADLATASVEHLSYGQKRQLEFAMAISQEPRMLLLDEPLAGMSPRESEQIAALIGRLRERYAILLVEHDMLAVFALATTVTVLVRGQVLASGTAKAIRDDPAVRSAYLGDEEVAA